MSQRIFSRSAVRCHMMRQLVLAAVALMVSVAPVAAKDDPPPSRTRDPAVLSQLVPALCANAWLRFSLQGQMNQYGDRDWGARRLLNCFKPIENALHAKDEDLLAALDVACPGADVRLWLDNPSTLPKRGCGDTFTQPDWGARPSVSR